MKTILVIEDEDRVRDTIKDILELEGFNAIVAANGKAGLQQALTCKPDLILCDVMATRTMGKLPTPSAKQFITVALYRSANNSDDNILSSTGAPECTFSKKTTKQYLLATKIRG